MSIVVAPSSQAVARAARALSAGLALAGALCAGGCRASKRRAGPAPGAAQIEVVRGLADQTCRCDTDRDCVVPIRAEWERIGRDLLARRAEMSPVDQATFDAQWQRFRQCGDAAGLTIWMP